jgi:hypothetical protein
MVVLISMELRWCLGVLVGLSLVACTTSAAPIESEPGPAPPAPPETLDAPDRSPNREEGIRGAAPTFANPTIAPTAAPACVADQEPSGRCIMTHDIDTNTLAHDITMMCGEQKQASNGCSARPVSFEFVDEFAKRPQKITIAFDTGYFCAAAGAGTMQVVELNGEPIGVFDGNTSDCSCQATSKPRVIEVPGGSLTMLKPGLMNRVSIVGPNTCLALRPKAEWNGAYARVIATY